MNAVHEMEYWAAVRSDLMVFLEQAFAEIYPNKDFLPNWHIDALVHRLELAITGKMQRQAINVPPRSGKSFVMSVVLPAFILGHDPTVKVVCASYSEELAKALALDCRRIVESEWYRRIFPEVNFLKSSIGELVTSAGGSRIATSVGGTITGRGADFVIVDDPIKPEDAKSDKLRLAVNEWYRSTMLSRLEDKVRSVFIVVMQRLHVNDLTGYLESDGDFHKLALPAIATVDEMISLRNGKTHLRLAGEALHSEREDVETLTKMRDAMGKFNFAAQYQQSPSTPEGTLIKRKWLKLVDQLPPTHPDGALYVSIDTALSTAATADFTAIMLTYVIGPDIYIFQTYRGRWEYEELQAIAQKLLKRYDNQVRFVVEWTGAGISLTQWLRKNALSNFTFLPTEDKVARVAKAIPILADGRVHIVNRPKNDAWVEPLINELVNFPYGRYDDQVDTLSQLLVFLDRRHDGGGRFYTLPKAA